jgi:2',3'-cyclic-nucleotide 2'-phosphodiesterase (5'-nucleotidase family)
MKIPSSVLLAVFCIAPLEKISVMSFTIHGTNTHSSRGRASASKENIDQIDQWEPHRGTKHSSGGRAPTTEDNIDSTDQWEPAPVLNSEARLIILQITDVYTLENFASFKTLLQETRKNVDAKVVCMLTGDFLSPYLLSSVDQGKGMMGALNRIPLDYLTWGNHEADIPHKVVCRHVRNFKGKWLNSNMLDHEA